MGVLIGVRPLIAATGEPLDLDGLMAAIGQAVLPASCVFRRETTFVYLEAADVLALAAFAGPIAAWWGPRQDRATRRLRFFSASGAIEAAYIHPDHLVAAVRGNLTSNYAYTELQPEPPAAPVYQAPSLRTKTDEQIVAELAGLTPGLVALDDADLVAAEAELGFELPALLRAVYRQVGDGGFGPDYQLLPLKAVVRDYLDRRARFTGGPWAWPEAVLPALTWGCDMYACVDCSSPDSRVLLFEPNPGDPARAWYLDSPSLAIWFEQFLAGSGWWQATEENPDVRLPPIDRPAAG